MLEDLDAPVGKRIAKSCDNAVPEPLMPVGAVEHTKYKDEVRSL